MVSRYVAFAGSRMVARHSFLTDARGLMPDASRQPGHRALFRRPQIWQAYLACAALGGVLYLLVAPLKGDPLFFNALGLTSWIAVIVGVTRNRPAYPLPWWLLAAALCLFWIGDVYTYSVPKYILHHEVPFPSLGDAVYLSVYVAAMLGLLLLVRRRNPRRDRNTLIDAAILTLGLSLLSWVLLIAPYLHDGSLDLLPKLVSVAYPLGDILLLAAAIRLVLDGGRRRPAFYLLSAGIVSVLVTDFVYGVMTLDGSFHHQLLLDAGWLAYQVFWGAAALHPSMIELDKPSSGRGAKLTPLRLSLLSAASLIAPACILVLELHHGSLKLIVVICASVVLFSLVVLRMAGLARRQERSVERERSLAREAARLSEQVGLQRSEARFAALVQNSSDLITVVGSDAVITYQSPSCVNVLGYTQDELVGTRYDHLVVGDDAGGLLRLLADGYSGPDGEAIQCTLRHHNGGQRHFEIHHTNLLGNEQVRGIVLNGRDVSERKVFEAQLAHQAFHDPVTNLANRALLMERARHAIGRARREHGELGVLFLDIDDFKTINDTLGHEAGDDALIAVAKRVSDSLRSSDTAARFGEDEFVVLLEDLDGDLTAIEIAARVLESLRRPMSIAGKQLSVQASMGVSLLSGNPTTTAEELVRDADAAMYVAKRERKGGYRMFDAQMHAGVLARIELRSDLRLALAAGQFELHYQPIVRLDDDRTTAVEALLRWHHPERGLVPPLDFIPFAEESGQIVPIGRWVLRESCRQAVALQEFSARGEELSVCVNLSVCQLQHRDVVSQVGDALRESGLAARLLMLEITESMLIEDPDSAIATLMELRALGVRIALDDFGTGYSSLSYLSRFPLDVIKMDRSFLWPSATEDGAALVSAIVALGGSLGLQVIAEGVEQVEQVKQLRDLGCGFGQGFYFAKPMPLGALLEYVCGDSSREPVGAGAVDTRASVD
jgi:diguanylate cyclase (GGDEF)-like protein/PAS domain S-box-containing protein